MRVDSAVKRCEADEGDDACAGFSLELSCFFKVKGNDSEGGLTQLVIPKESTRARSNWSSYSQES